MRNTVGVLLMAAVMALLALGQLVQGRPQGSLPIADLIPTRGIQVRPEDQVTLYDLTRDTLNEVNAPPSPSSSAVVFADDVTFRFPGGPSSSVGQVGAPSFPPGSPTSNFDFSAGSSTSSFNFPSGSPTSNFDFSAGSSISNFDFPPRSPTSNFDFSAGSSTTNFDFGIPSIPVEQLSGLSVNVPGTDDVQFNIPGPSASPGFGPSDNLEILVDNFAPSLGAPVTDDVQLPFPDPTGTANGPFQFEQDAGLLSSKASGSGISVGNSFDAGVEPEATYTLLSASFPSLDAHLTELRSDPDFQATGTSGDNAHQRTLGNGNQRIPDNRDEKDELLSLLTLGLLSNQQPSAHLGGGGGGLGNSNPSSDPLKGLFNFITLGLFDNNQSASNPLKELLSTLSSGLLGNGNQGSSSSSSGFLGGGGLDLSKFGLGPEAIADLVQLASSGIDDLVRETSQGVRLAQDEVQFLSREKVQQVINNLQQTGRTFGTIGQNTYRSILQKKSVLSKLLMGVVENFGSFVNTSVGNTFQKVGATANTFGRFINDLKVGVLNTLIAKGEAIRELVSGTLGTVGTAVTDFTSAAQVAAEDNIRSITGIKTVRKFR